MSVRSVPWVSVQPSIHDVVKDVAQGATGAWEDVWASVYASDEARTSAHMKWRIAKGEAGVAVTCEAPTARVSGTNPIEVETSGAVRVEGAHVHIAERTGTLPQPLGSGRAPTVMDLSPVADGTQRYAVGGAGGALYAGAWSDDAPLGEREQIACAGHASDITSVRFFPSGQVILSTSLDMRARVFSALDGSCPRVLEGHTRAVQDCAILGRGREVATGSSDGTVRLWDVGQNTTVATWRAEAGVSAVSAVQAAASVPESRQGMLVAGTDAGELKAWDVREPPRTAWGVVVPRSPLATHAQGAQGAQVEAVDASDTSVLVGTSHGVCAVYDTRQATDPVSAWHRNLARVSSVQWQSGTAYVSSSDGLPYSLCTDTGQVHEYAGWDAEATTCIRRSACGRRTVVLGYDSFCLYA